MLCKVYNNTKKTIKSQNNLNLKWQFKGAKKKYFQIQNVSRSNNKSRK